MFAGCLKTSGVLSAVTLILALFYQRYKYADLSTEIPNILDSLQKAEKQVSKNALCLMLFSCYRIIDY